MAKPKTPDYASLLKEWRARKALTQEAAAVELGITVHSIRNWEVRRYVPNGPVRSLLLKKLTE